jgi:hypothetical protein
MDQIERMNTRQLDRILKQMEGKALSAHEVTAMCGARVILYEELAQYRSIDDMLQGDRAIVILYQNTQYSGHYVALLKKGNLIEFFDSYGMKPDEELRYVEYNRIPLLTRLLQSAIKDGCRVIYNATRLQSMRTGINDCGEFAGMRIRMYDLSQEDFLNMFKGSNPDKLVSLMTLLFKYNIPKSVKKVIF